MQGLHIGHTGHIEICRICKNVAICHNIPNWILGIFEHIFCSIFHMVLHIFCHILHIFLHIRNFEANRSEPVSAVQRHAELESVVNWSFSVLYNPQEAGSGSIRTAAAWSSGTGRHGQHWHPTDQACSRTVLLPSIYHWELTKLLQNMQNVRMQNMQNMNYMQNMLKLVKYTE